jgi:hypothetical protein
MMSFVCLDLGYGGSKNNNRDFKSASGIASVYDRSSGKQTASGEQLDEDALTAAHRSHAKTENRGGSDRILNPAIQTLGQSATVFDLTIYFTSHG